jgi:hypothetical protein
VVAGRTTQIPAMLATASDVVSVRLVDEYEVGWKHASVSVLHGVHGFGDAPVRTDDSGHAWQKRGLVELYGDYMAFPEGRGTRFMPAVHYVDFRVAHKFTFKNEQSIEGSLDVFNLPDFDKPITYYENDNASFGKVLFRQEPRAIRAGLKYTY